jgi:hypothetical protein
VTAPSRSSRFRIAWHSAPPSTTIVELARDGCGLKIIVRGAGSPDRCAERVSPDRPPKGTR